MGRTHYEKVVFEGLWDTVPGCRKITTKASCGTKWRKMEWTTYEKQVFERFWTPCWDAEKSSPAQVRHQMDQHGTNNLRKCYFWRIHDWREAPPRAPWVGRGALATTFGRPGGLCKIRWILINFWCIPASLFYVFYMISGRFCSVSDVA